LLLKKDRNNNIVIQEASEESSTTNVSINENININNNIEVEKINNENNEIITIKEGDKVKSDKPKVRQSNFELLRIISMLLIVAHHFSVHGGMKHDTKKVTVNRLWSQFISIGGKIGVNIFVLISGYFLTSSKKVKINKFLKLELQMIFYAVIQYLIGVKLCKFEEFSLKNLKHNIFPVTYGIWWFAQTYVILYLLFPLINGCIHGISRQTHRNYLIVTTMIWCIIPTIFEVNAYSSNFLIWFGFIYFVAGYLRKYKVAENTKAITWILLGIGTYILIFLTAVINDYRAISNEKALKYTNYLFDLKMIPVLFSALFLFIGFSKLNIKSRAINFISATTFGIYLIHDHPMIRHLIWMVIVKVPDFTNSSYLIPFSIFVIVAVFTVCSIIEAIRIYTIERLYMNLVNYISSKLENIITKFNNSKFIKNI